MRAAARRPDIASASSEIKLVNGLELLRARKSVIFFHSAGESVKVLFEAGSLFVEILGFGSI